MGVPTERTFTVTVLNAWSTVVKAQTHDDAKKLALKIFVNEMTKNGIMIASGYLWNYTKAKVEEVAKGTWNFFETPLQLNHLSETDKQWLTGFWEGDGSITRFSTVFQIVFSQKDPQILYVIQKLLGEKFRLYDSTRYSGDWRLYINQKHQIIPLLNLICEGIVSPLRLKQIDELAQKLHLPLQHTLVEHEPTWPWIAGFWDAEGTSSFSGDTLHVEIAQKDIVPLQKIQNFVRSGRVYIHGTSGYQLCWFSRSEVIEVSKQLLEYTRILRKKEKLYAQLQFLRYKEE